MAPFQQVQVFYNGTIKIIQIDMISPSQEFPPLNSIHIFTPNTCFSFTNAPPEPSSPDTPVSSQFTYDNIGGLEEEIKLVRETLDFSLHTPTKFAKYNITPPRGILLFGPPGTGKTLIARAAASQSNAHFIIINGPEHVSGVIGESEAKLREIFKEARDNSPSIIFIDEIDSLCPKRSDVCVVCHYMLIIYM